MPKKNFKANTLNKVNPKSETSSEPESAVIILDKPVLTYRRIDMSDWLNRGVDLWVHACISIFKKLLSNKTVAPATVISNYMAFPNFLRFITQCRLASTPNNLDRHVIEDFIEWLHRSDRGWSQVTQKAIYSGTKSALTSMQRYGLAAGDRNIFPRNPYPGSNGAGKGEKALSERERVQLAQMLRKEIISIYKGTFKGVEGEALTILATALAMRTGLNQTSLLELRRDGLRPHPFMPNMMLLESYKRRGNATHVSSLRYSVSEQEFSSLPMDGVALFKMVLERNQALAEESQDETIQQSVWIYRQASRKREITLLSTKVMARTIQRFVDDNGLTSDDGSRLFINVSRLRKTLENRLWMLSGGDLTSVASVMGHSPAVADTHYLTCTDEIRKNATFVGEALPEIYRGIDISGESEVSPIVELKKTPVGSCKDTQFGEYAPKDGVKHCSDFLSCFNCRSYAIIGSAADLHRLFSFYWFLHAEIRKGGSKDWLKQFQKTLDIIDSFTIEKFEPSVVYASKSKAKIEPIKFWKTYQIELRGDN